MEDWIRFIELGIGDWERIGVGLAGSLLDGGLVLILILVLVGVEWIEGIGWLGL